MPKLDLDSSEKALLESLSATVDMNLARLSQAEKGVKVSTEMLRACYEIILRGRGLNSVDYRLILDPAGLRIELKGD